MFDGSKLLRKKGEITHQELSIYLYEKKKKNKTWKSVTYKKKKADKFNLGYYGASLNTRHG